MKIVQFSFKNGGKALGKLTSDIQGDWADVEIIKPYSGRNEELMKYYSLGRKFQTIINQEGNYSSNNLITEESHPEAFL